MTITTLTPAAYGYADFTCHHIDATGTVTTHVAAGIDERDCDDCGASVCDRHITDLRDASASLCPRCLAEFRSGDDDYARDSWADYTNFGA